MQDNIVLGIDVGGSGIKGGLVNVATGELLGERLRLETPQPATPEAMAVTFAELVKMHQWTGLVGCGFPAIIKHNVAHTASNIDPSWVDVNVADLFSKTSGCTVEVMNDADAAGIAIMRFGIGKGMKGVVLVITIGTGLGSALFLDGQLLPNTEFGQLIMHNMIAEQYAADSVRKRLELSWEDWGGRFNEYLNHLEDLLSPDLIILGGGGSKVFHEFEAFLHLETVVRPAFLQNHAGTIGAALNAWELHH